MYNENSAFFIFLHDVLGGHEQRVDVLEAVELALVDLADEAPESRPKVGLTKEFAVGVKKSVLQITHHVMPVWGEQYILQIQSLLTGCRA